jgi:Kef-type K+ transport system membrane component KefB
MESAILAATDHSILADVGLCIVAAWILAIITQTLRQPMLLAYLVAGLLIGPEVGFGIVQDKDSITTISELGLILLLFMIGLEMDLKHVLGAGKQITLTAVSQIAGCFLLGVFVFWMLGFKASGDNLGAIYLAAAGALSSTVIIVKLLYDKRELNTLPGRITLGVLVLQDVFAILFLALQPNLGNPSLGVIALSGVKVAGLVGAAFGASRYILPTLFRNVARIPELVLVGALAWCFIVAGMAGDMGLSMEMGALIAGISISTFPYTLDVVAKTTTLRDFFVTLFFVGLGMQVPRPEWEFVRWALVFAAFVIISRMATVVPPLLKTKSGHRASIIPAVYLAQVSEFSLVIVTMGAAKFGHVGQEIVGIVSYAFVITAVLSTYAVAHAEAIMKWTSGWFSDFNVRDLDEHTVFLQKPKHEPRIYLLGFSWAASSLLEELQKTSPDVVEKLGVIDFNPQVVERLRKRGVYVKYGDIGQRDTLLNAGVDKAEVIVSSLPNTVLRGTNNLRLVQLLREINPTARIIAHAELLPDVPRLYAIGASYVTVPRFLEADDLLNVIVAAQDNLLEEKRTAQQAELQGRDEIIP